MLGAEEDFMVDVEDEDDEVVAVDEATGAKGADDAPDDVKTDVICVWCSLVDFLILGSVPREVEGTNCGDCDLRTELTGTLHAGWAGGGAG